MRSTTACGRAPQAVEAGEVAVIDALMEPLHPADIADLLEQVTAGERAAWLALWSKGIDGEVLSELDWGLREEVIGSCRPRCGGEAVRELDRRCRRHPRGSRGRAGGGDPRCARRPGPDGGGAGAGLSGGDRRAA
jgi:hypothetical protein